MLTPLPALLSNWPSGSLPRDAPGLSSAAGIQAPREAWASPAGPLPQPSGCADGVALTGPTVVLSQEAIRANAISRLAAHHCLVRCGPESDTACLLPGKGSLPAGRPHDVDPGRRK